MAGNYAPNYYGGGGGSAVLVIDDSGSIPSQVGSTASIEITCNQSVTGLTLLFRVETLAKVDVATVADADIVKDDTSATLSLTSAMTASERTLRWSLTNTSTGEAVASGLMFVTYDAQGDS